MFVRYYCGGIRFQSRHTIRTLKPLIPLLRALKCPVYVSIIPLYLYHHPIIAIQMYLVWHQVYSVILSWQILTLTQRVIVTGHFAGVSGESYISCSTSYELCYQHSFLMLDFVWLRYVYLYTVYPKLLRVLWNPVWKLVVLDDIYTVVATL